MPTSMPLTNKKIPVILDTDIGTDIDDTWALAFLLKSPELDIKLILTSTGDTYLRAKITAKLLEIAGRTDIPIAIGIPLEFSPCYQETWVEDYDLSQYKGQIIEDGIGSLVDTILQSPEPVTIIGISPAVNIAAALQRNPTIASKARFIGMFGSIRLGYSGSEKVAAEYNVVRLPYSLRKTLAADWPITITPLDTCGLIKFQGEAYKVLRDSRDPLLVAVMDNYRVWCQFNDNPVYNGFDPESESSILYDVVAVYLAFSEDWLTLETFAVKVTDDGYTIPDGSSSSIRWATTWKDRTAFENFVIARLSS